MTTASQDFEYESEDIEAGEMADYEMDEQDEGVEDIEAEGYEPGEDVETDESSDERVYETADEGEAVDESDGETDEALDASVSMSASARYRREQDARRRDQWARRVAADQRVEAQRATSTQKSITRQIQSIQPGGQARVYSVGPLQGAGVVTAVLPNGRRSRMRIIPTLAPVSEVNRLRAVIAINDRRQAKATSNNSRAIARLAVTQASAVRKLTAEQVKSDKDLRRRLVEGDNRLDKRITKELSGGSGILDRHGKKLLAQLREQRMRSVMNSVTLATALPFWASYGTKGDPFSRNNLTMGISTAGWLVGDELLDQFGGRTGGVKTFATIWSYLAWAGNGATMYFLLKDRQHQRFISGVTPVTNNSGANGDTDAVVLLTKNSSLIAKDFMDEFKGQRHTVVATMVDKGIVNNRDVRATLDGETLTLTVKAMTNGDTANVAWIVDTRPQVEVRP
jgi:hypothetical protein